MLIAPKFERGHLTIDEQESLRRKGLKDELARATAHRTAPIGASSGNGHNHKIMETAFRIVARVSHDAQAIDLETFEAEIDESWTQDEMLLLWKTLHLLVTPMSVSRTSAIDALKDIGVPLNEGTVTEARSQLLRGFAEAHHRAQFLDSHEIQASGRGVMALLDDALIGKAWQERNIERHNDHEEAAHSSSSPDTALSSFIDDNIYARPSDLKFSEVITPVLSALGKERGWKKDNGQRKAVCERATWICGDKPLHDWSAADAEYYATTIARFPNDFRWGELGESGPMALPFEEGIIPAIEPGKERNPRTINRDLSILQNVSKRLAKTHWRLKYGGGLEVDFLEYAIKVEDDPENPDRMPWTPEHLRVLYGLPLWQGSGGSLERLKTSASTTVWMDAAYWLPLIATYTGLCREEGAGLEVDDFNFECEVPYLVVKPHALRGLKTNARSRVMPLHPELIELGLNAYIDAIAAEQIQVDECTPAFPELWSDKAKHSAEGKKVPSIGGRRFYAIAWRYVADATHVVMPLPETQGGKKADFHSQRTYNHSVLASPDVAQAILDRHMGHAAKGTGQKKYNRRKLALGEVKELQERRDIMVREMPTVTSHIPRQKKVNLLPLRKRSRVGSAPGRDAQREFCQ